MARAKLKAEDIKKLKLFLHLTGGSIDFESGYWYLEYGGKLKILHSVPELTDHITGKLEEMKENYTEDAWTTAWNEAKKSKFHLKGESDRMDMRRYKYGFTGEERS